MVIDTSALPAILQDEPERPALARAISEDPIRLVCCVSVVEASLVILARFGQDGLDELDLLLGRIGAKVSSLSAQDIPLARQAYARFGKGRHPASLNFGDCFSYALAVSLNEPLLFKGGDFSQTDVARVAW